MFEGEKFVIFFLLVIYIEWILVLIKLDVIYKSDEIEEIII